MSKPSLASQPNKSGPPWPGCSLRACFISHAQRLPGGRGRLTPRTVSRLRRGRRSMRPMCPAGAPWVKSGTHCPGPCVARPASQMQKGEEEGHTSASEARTLGGEVWEECGTPKVSLGVSWVVEPQAGHSLGYAGTNEGHVNSATRRTKDFMGIFRSTPPCDGNVLGQRAGCRSPTVLTRGLDAPQRLSSTRKRSRCETAASVWARPLLRHVTTPRPGCPGAHALSACEALAGPAPSCATWPRHVLAALVLQTLSACEAL